MINRLIARVGVVCALSLTLLGEIPVLAQHDPRPPATPAPTVELDDSRSAASPAASTDGAFALGESRSLSVMGQPVALSPDGKWLAGPGPDRDFCIWDVATLDPACASDGRPMPVHLETVTWAPDSSAVAFSLDAARLFVDSDIYVMDIDGSLHNLTDDGDDDTIGFSDSGKEIPVDIYPAWSPDSSQLVFARTIWGGDLRPTTISAIDRDGGEPVQRFGVSPQEPFVIFTPMHWLDDGSIIFSVAHADVENTQNGVWRLTASGGVERIIAGDASAEIPTPFVNEVSADGRLATVFSYALAAQVLSDGKPAYFVLDLETGETHPVEIVNPEPGVRIMSAGAFLPDGSAVLSVQARGNELSLVLSDREGMAIGSAVLPEDAGPLPSFRGLSVSADGAVFMPMMATTDDGERRSLLFTVAGP